jgi:hypothetical protein
MPWSGIPKTFDLQTEDGIYEIQSNATKHMEDFIRGRTGRQIPNRGPLRLGVSDPRLLGDIMLQSLVSAIDYVLPLLGPGDNAVTDGFWELGINGTNHHVYHANCRW